MQFSEAVTGLAHDAVVVTSDIGDPLVYVVTPDPVDAGHFVVSVQGMTGPSTITVAVPAAVTQDPAGHDNLGSTNTDNRVVFDNVAPTVTVNQSAGQADPTGGVSVSFDIVFSEPVTHLGPPATDFGHDDVVVASSIGDSLDWTVTPGATAGSYTVTVTGMTAGSTITASVPAGTITDPAGNGNEASTGGDSQVAYVHSGTIQFSAATYEVDETGSPTLTVTVTRTGGTEGPLDVHYATANGTALAGIDYDPASGDLHWAAGDTTDKTFTVKVLDDGGLEADSAFTVNLSGISLPGALGTPATATVSIREQAVLAFSAPRFDTAEDDVGHADVTATVLVSRQFGSQGAVSADYAITGGTATAGSDYTVTGTLTWAEGDMDPKPITFTIKDDTLNEGKETVFLTLTLPAAPQNAVLGAQATTALVIDHSDGTKVDATAKPPRVTFTNDDQEVVTVTLGGKIGSMTVYRYNGAGDIAEIALSGTDPAKSAVTVAVKKPRGLVTDGRVQLGEVTGTRGQIPQPGQGRPARDWGARRGDHPVLVPRVPDHRGRSERSGYHPAGAPPAKPVNAGTRITAGRIQGTAADPTDITFTDPKGRLASLTATSVGEGTITAASAGAITAKGKPKSKAHPAGLPGDFNSDLVISGVGVDPARGKALAALKVAVTTGPSPGRRSG